MFSHGVFCGVTTQFLMEGLKHRKHGCHNFQPLCFLWSYNPISHGESETPKTRLSPRLATVFFYGVTTQVLTDGLKHRKHDRHHVQPLCFYGVTTLFPADALKHRKYDRHHFPTSVFYGVTTLFLVDGLKHRKRGCHNFQSLCFFAEL